MSSSEARDGVRAWLNRRYDSLSPDGVYVAHQPIYGFRAGYCEPWLADRYVRTVAMLRALARLRWNSLLDVGGSEGYKAHLARQFLGGAHVISSDLSAVACRRARDIYGLETVVADVQALPFADGKFDVVTCSETLEHVPNFEVAVRELVRVSRCAVVITVPHEPADRLGGDSSTHDHLHALNARSLDFLVEDGFSVRVTRLLSPLVSVVGGLIEGVQRHTVPGSDKPLLALRLHDWISARTARITGERAEAALIDSAGVLCHTLPWHRALMFVVVKDIRAQVTRPRAKITARQTIASRVPLHTPES